MATRTIPNPPEAACPCCGDPMEPLLVVCWTCYYATDRLQPGAYSDPNGTTTTPDGYAIVVTEAQIAEWDKVRSERTATWLDAQLAEITAERDAAEANSFRYG